MWKQILVALAVISSPWIANAAPRSTSTPSSSPVVSYSSPSSYSYGGSHKHEIGIDLSINPGISLGADYAYMFQEKAGVGGYLRFWAKETNQKNPSHGFFAFGPMVSVKYTMDNWEAFLAPGFGFVNIESYDTNTKKSTFSMGPRAGYGLLYKVNQNIGLGFEHSNYWIWFNSDWNGQIISDFALRFKANF